MKNTIFAFFLLTSGSIFATNYFVRTNTDATSWNNISDGTVITLSSGNLLPESISGDSVFYLAPGTYKTAGTSVGNTTTKASTNAKIYGGFSGLETSINLGARITSDKDANGIVEPWEFVNEAVITTSNDAYKFTGVGADGIGLLTVSGTGAEMNGVTITDFSCINFTGPICIGKQATSPAAFGKAPAAADNIPSNAGVLRNCIVRKIKGNTGAGAIMTTNENSLVEKCLVEGNISTAANQGGAIYMNVFGGRVSGCVIRNNAAIGSGASGRGAAIFANSSNGATDSNSNITNTNLKAIVENCVIYNNYSNGYGGAIRGEAQIISPAVRGLQIINCTVVNNQTQVLPPPVPGLDKFDFSTETGLQNYPFAITSDVGTNSYIVQNLDSFPKGTDITNLKASFSLISSVFKLNGVDQVSGVTAQNFTNAIVFQAVTTTGVIKTYKVIVNVAKADFSPIKYVLFNQGTYTDAEVKQISTIFGPQKNKRTAVGLGVYFMALNNTPATNLSKINSQLALSLKYEIPICLKFDAELFWGSRPELWNWWDPTKPGFNENNKDNVEWTDWNRDSAIKISWLNWGTQIRMAPSVNMMSVRYIEACKLALDPCVHAIKTWYDALPQDKKYLFAGIIIGWESSIGVSTHYFSNGNDYVNLSPANDPTKGFDINKLPSRGLQTIGYAAVKTAGIASSGILTEGMQAEVVRRHLENQSKIIFDGGISRDRIFTHSGGWINGESLYKAAVNKYSCPGWSFYTYATDPLGDVTAMNALKMSDAPYFGAVEWFLFGEKAPSVWASALSKTLANKCRLLSIYNWTSLVVNQVVKNQNAIDGIKYVNK